jgi:hypothetical protein
VLPSLNNDFAMNVAIDSGLGTELLIRQYRLFYESLFPLKQNKYIIGAQAKNFLEKLQPTISKLQSGKYDFGVHFYILIAEVEQFIKKSFPENIVTSFLNPPPPQKTDISPNVVLIEALRLILNIPKDKRTKKQEAAYKYMFQFDLLSKISQSVKDNGLHPAIKERDQTKYGRYNILVEYKTSRTIEVECIELLSLEKVKSGYVEPYCFNRPFFLNGLKLQPKNVHRLTVTLSLLKDEEIRFFKADRKFRTELDFARICDDVTNMLIDQCLTESSIPDRQSKKKLRHSGASHKNIQRTVHPVHFEDLSGMQFERLVFAYMQRSQKGQQIQWLGQSGGDGGRDILIQCNKRSSCVQCANYKKLTFSKVKKDIDKLLKSGALPDSLIVVCGGLVSADLRKKISSHAQEAGIHNTEVWSGPELEERLRSETPDLLQRFVQGEEFPEMPL